MTRSLTSATSCEITSFVLMRIWAISAVMVGLVGLAWPLAATPAFAQPKAPAADATMTEARQRFNEGIKFADDGNHEAARLKFGQAWALLKSPAILYNLARSEQLSGHLVDSLEHYRLFLKMASDPKVTEVQKQRATENVAELSNKLGQVDVDAAPSSRITIDGKPVEWTAQNDPIPVLPGSHEVTATLDGKTNKVTVECTPGTVSKASLRASREPAAPPPATATSPSPSVAAEARPDSGHGFWTTGRAVGTGLAVAGLASIGVGVVFHLRASATVDDIDAMKSKLTGSKSTACNAPVPADQATCRALVDKADEVKSAETLRTIMWIGGGALAAGGIALFLLSPPGRTSEPARGLRFVPYASGREAGVAAFASF